MSITFFPFIINYVRVDVTNTNDLFFMFIAVNICMGQLMNLNTNENAGNHIFYSGNETF